MRLKKPAASQDSESTSSRGAIRIALYRPFTKQHLYFDRVLERTTLPHATIFPTPATEREPRHLLHRHWIRESDSCALVPDFIPRPSLGGRDARPVLPLLHLRRRRQQPPREHHRLGAGAIPHALPRPAHHQVGHLPLRLCHPAPPAVPRALRRQPQPRTAPHPFAPDFRAFAAAGKQLADLHVDYEQQPEYPLTRREKPRRPTQLARREDEASAATRPRSSTTTS